ncbi:MAG TPA: MFS transporter [Rubrobacteraceae bacterium]|nr:MFS transporter [Rubrobacteraceae bacterium]
MLSRDPGEAPRKFLRGAKGTFAAFDRRVWLLLAAMLVFRFGQGLYYPFSTIYFHNVIGIPLSLVGVGLSCLAVSSVAAGFVSGPLTDRYGRKPVMLASLSGSAATFLAFTLVDGFAGYLTVSVLAGLFGSSSFDAARNAMVADVTPLGLRSRAYGLVRVGGNVGWGLGPMVAGLVSAAAGGAGWIYPFLFAGTAALTALVMLSLAVLARESLPAVAMRSPSSGRFSGRRVALSDSPFLVLLGVGVLMYYVFTQDWQALPIYAKNFLGVPDGKIGFFLGANGLVVILLQLPISYLIDRSSKVLALLAGAALFGASSATLLLTDSFIGILLAFAGFFTLAEMVLEVAGPALAADLAPVKLRGTYLGLFGSCFGLSYGISPLVAGPLLQAGLPHAVWTIQLAAVALAAAGLIALATLRRR